LIALAVGAPVRIGGIAGGGAALAAEPIMVEPSKSMAWN
jgi:hypothetical protein